MKTFSHKSINNHSDKWAPAILDFTMRMDSHWQNVNYSHEESISHLKIPTNEEFDLGIIIATPYVNSISPFPGLLTVHSKFKFLYKLARWCPILH